MHPPALQPSLADPPALPTLPAWRVNSVRRLAGFGIACSGLVVMLAGLVDPAVLRAVAR